jgi:hypothetical protein
MKAAAAGNTAATWVFLTPRGGAMMKVTKHDHVGTRAEGAQSSIPRCAVTQR